MKLGETLMTRGIAKAIEQDFLFKVFIYDSFQRYEQEDWGEMCKEDLQENDRALKEGCKVFASYNIPDNCRKYEDDKVWIITEADRSATTILFPSEC